MKTRKPAFLLDEIAGDHFTQIIDLAPGILSRVEKEKKTRMKTISKSFIAVPAIMLALALIFVAIPGVTKAMTRLLGYVSGVGVVDQTVPLRALAEPVKASQNGITIIVEQAVLDGEETRVLFQVDNLVSPEKPGEGRCTRNPVLRLPDGTELEGDGRGSGWALGYVRHFTYPPVPSDVNNLVLVFPCLQQTALSAAPANWEIPLHFVPAPADMVIHELIDLPTPTAPATATAADTATDGIIDASSTDTAPAPQEPEDGALAPADITLAFTSMVPLDTGSVLFGSLQPADADVKIGMVDSSAAHLVDSAGQEIYLEEDHSSELAPLPEINTFPLAYATTGTYAPGLATFTIDSMWVDQRVEAGFAFDPGPDPQPGETWPLNLDVEVAGHTLRIASATLGTSGKGLTFIFDPTSEIQDAILTDNDHPLAPSGGGGSGSSGFAYAGDLPQGPIAVSISSISYVLAGPWQTTLDLPVTTTTVEPTAQPALPMCLSRAAYHQSVASKAALPADLSGKLAISFMKEGDYNYQVGVTNLDGSDRQEFGYGEWPSLSPDGSKLVYTGESGLILVDLATNQSTPIAGTTRADRDSIWSPDGTQIAFTRGPSTLIGAPGPYLIWVVQADGTNLRQVTLGSAANHAKAWLPTGDRILYTAEKADGASVRTIDVQTGEIAFLFDISYTHATMALSPDGKRVAFEEVLPGDRYATFIANLDGSNRRLLSDPSPLIATIPLWSPDGKWLALSVIDPDSKSFLSNFTLIEVDTCQIVPLPELHGYGFTWIR